MPHELSHAFGLSHAPCGGASDPDPWFAQNSKNGMMLSDGWDFSNGSVPNGAKIYDLMRYCTPYWIGAYDWGKIVSFFQSGPPPNAANTTTPADFQRLDPLPADQMALHVFALIGERSMVFTAAWTDYGSPFHVTDPGPVIFQGLDDKGNTLFTATAPLLVIHPGDKTGAAQLNIPIGIETAAALHSLRMSYAGNSVLRTALPGKPITASAVAIDADHVQVTFDGTKFQSLTVRPLNTSSDNSTIVDGNGSSRSMGVVNTNAKDIYIDFQDGVKTIARAIRVHVAAR